MEEWSERVDAVYGPMSNVATAITPFASDLRDVTELYTGRDFITGATLSQRQQDTTAMGAMMPMVLSGKVLRVGDGVVQNGLQWSKGHTAATSLDNLRAHFAKHNSELKQLGINTPQKMYDEAVDMAKLVDNKNVFRLVNPRDPSRINIYDKARNLLVGINNGEISTLHTVTDPKKFSKIQTQVKKIVNKILR